MEYWITINQKGQEFNINISEVKFYTVSGKNVIFHFGKDHTLMLSDENGKVSGLLKDFKM